MHTGTFYQNSFHSPIWSSPWVSKQVKLHEKFEYVWLCADIQSDWTVKNSGFNFWNVKEIGIKDPTVHCGPSFQFSCSFPHLLGTQEDSLTDRLTNGLEESMGAKGKRRPRPIFSLPPAPNNLNSYVVLGSFFQWSTDYFLFDLPQIP